MNIVTQYPNINFNTANVATESVRKDNQQRERIPKTVESESSPAERGVTREQTERQAPLTYSPQQPDQQQPAENQQAERQQAESDREEAEGNEQEREQRQEQEQERRQEEQVQQKVTELKDRDREVRLHEQAHASVGGQYAGSPSYTFERGPDGANYAVAGEVPIDVAPVAGDPEATIRKMQQVRAAALAPAEPSGPDKAIASEASQKMVDARAEMTRQITERVSSDNNSGDTEQVDNSGSDAQVNQATGTQASGTVDGVSASDGVSRVAEASVVAPPPPPRASAQSDIDLSDLGSGSAGLSTARRSLRETADMPDLSSRSGDVNARAARVENFYQKVSVPNFPQFTQSA